MGMQPRFWWQQIKQHRVAIGVVAIVLVIVIALIIISYYNGTGFNRYNQVTTARTIRVHRLVQLAELKCTNQGKAFGTGYNSSLFQQFLL